MTTQHTDILHLTCLLRHLLLNLISGLIPRINKTEVHMQGAMTRILLGSVMFSAAICQVQAEALQPDPAWQEGRLRKWFPMANFTNTTTPK